MHQASPNGIFVVDGNESDNYLATNSLHIAGNYVVFEPGTLWSWVEWLLPARTKLFETLITMGFTISSFWQQHLNRLPLREKISFFGTKEGWYSTRGECIGGDGVETIINRMASRDGEVVNWWHRVKVQEQYMCFFVGKGEIPAPGYCQNLEQWNPLIPSRWVSERRHYSF